MKSVKILQTNTVIGAGQEETYTPLNAFRWLHEQYGLVYDMCFELSQEEILEIIQTSRIWYQRLSFSFPPSELLPQGILNKYQPMAISTKNPMADKSDDILARSTFPEELVEFVVRYSKMRNTHHPINDNHEITISGLALMLKTSIKKAEQSFSGSHKSKAFEEIAHIALRLSQAYKNKTDEPVK